MNGHVPTFRGLTPAQAALGLTARCLTCDRLFRDAAHMTQRPCGSPLPRSAAPAAGTVSPAGASDAVREEAAP